MTEEEQVLAAARAFYDALEHMITGKGLGPMHEAWHHAPHVTTAHPLGDWSSGWEEVESTWEIFGKIGRPEMAGSTVRDLRAWVHGDVARTTCVFVSGPFAGALKLNCTNMLQRINGAWKIIHHHADASPGLAAALEKMAAQG
jgi:hypothetical protein